MELNLKVWILLGCVLQSSFGKYLLVETKDKDGTRADDYHDDGTNHTHDSGGLSDPIHVEGTNLTLPKIKLKENQYVKQRIVKRIANDYDDDFDGVGVECIYCRKVLGEEECDSEPPNEEGECDLPEGIDYHDTGFPHTHGPDSQEDNATHQTTPEAGQDYHDTGYYHTHSPDSIEEGRNDPHNRKYDGANEAIGKTLKKMLKNLPIGKKPGQDYHDTGFDHTHRPKGRRNNKHTRNKKRKTSKKRTPKRMRPRWSNVQ